MSDAVGAMEVAATGKPEATTTGAREAAEVCACVEGERAVRGADGAAYERLDGRLMNAGIGASDEMI